MLRSGQISTIQPARQPNSPFPSNPESNVGRSEVVQKVEVEQAFIRRQQAASLHITSKT